MTPERFRQWIVILLALAIVTMWVNMITSTRRIASITKRRSPMMTGRTATERRSRSAIPGSVRQRTPRPQVPKAKSVPTDKSVSESAPAKK